MTDEGPHPNNETGHIEWEILPFNVACFLAFRLFPLIRPGLRPVHLPRRGRLPPGGEGFLPAGDFTAPAVVCRENSISLLAGWVKEGHFHRKTPIFFEKNFLSVLAPGKMPKTWPICAKKRIGDRFPFEFHKIPPWGIGGEM